MLNNFFGFIDGDSSYNPSILIQPTSNTLQVRVNDADNNPQLYDYELSNRSDILGWTTLAEIYGAYYVKRNYVVTLVIDFADVTVVHNDVIGILPSGCRPPGCVYCRNGFDNQNGEFAVYNSGEVKYLSSTGPCSYGHAALTFVTL